MEEVFLTVLHHPLFKSSQYLQVRGRVILTEARLDVLVTHPV